MSFALRTRAAAAALMASAPLALALALPAAADELVTLPGARPTEEAPAQPGFEGVLGVRSGALFFAALDADGDLVITQAERAAGYPRAFAHADRDGSGGLSLLEYADFAELALGAREARPGVVALDYNQDRDISPDEFAAGFETVAARYADDAGAIAFSALTVDLGELAEERGPRGGRPPRP